MRRKDRELGLDRNITRRDFVHGAGALAMSLAAGGSRIASGQSRSAGDRRYPPALGGLRGSHRGSFEVAHALAFDGRSDWGPIEDTGEPIYDLVVVGAGVSGLSAAYFYRARYPDARILLLENHDDFGGHAKRNEFQVAGRLLLGHGGSQSLQEPGRYSELARGLIEEIGVDLASFEVSFDRDLFTQHRLATGVYFDADTYGADRLVRFSSEQLTAWLPIDTRAPTILEAIEQFPIAEAARAQLKSLYQGNPAKQHPGWRALPLLEMSYRDLLVEVGVDHPQVLQYLDGLPTPIFCVGIDALPAAYALATGLPGPAGSSGGELSEPYIHHFPDGNASIARLLVRSLIPQALPGKSMQDVVTALARYDELDRDGRQVRLRLDSTAVHVAHEGAPASAETVEAVYVRGGKAERVRGRRCVLACWNMIIPFICPDVPDEQGKALRRLVKSPLVYTNVALRNWQPWKRLGVAATYAPSRWHHLAFLDFPVSIGAYHYPTDPDQPAVVHMDWEPRSPGKPAVDQFRAGRKTLLRTPFEEIELEVRRHLAGMLGSGGFDPAKDILGLTVNRWPHGYAPTAAVLPKEDAEAHLAGRKPIGRIAIANSDSGAMPLLNVAIDQAWRAVSELPA